MSAQQDYPAFESSDARREITSISGAPPSPVKLWAGIGTIILSIFAWTLFQWITSPYFKPAPAGDDPISPKTLMLVHITDIFCGVFSFGFLFWFITGIRHRMGARSNLQLLQLHVLIQRSLHKYGLVGILSSRVAIAGNGELS
jgi:hypothetical protein